MTLLRIGPCAPTLWSPVTAGCAPVPTLSPQESELTSLPNPAVGQTSVSFTLPEEGSFRLEVLNMQGAVVAVLGEGSGKAGQRFSYEFKKGSLKGDLYIAHLVTGGGNKFTRIELKD